MKLLHVLAGILQRPDGQVLVAERRKKDSGGSLWEFPGGKHISGETRFTALARELREELGVAVHQESARPLIRFQHRYPELMVDLDFWRIGSWQGEPYGREGQPLAWHTPARLLDVGLLPADAPAVNAIRLPSICAVTPATPSNRQVHSLRSSISTIAEMASATMYGPPSHGISSKILEHCKPLVVLRVPEMQPQDLVDMGRQVTAEESVPPIQIVLHGDPRRLIPLLESSEGGETLGLHVPGRHVHCLGARDSLPISWLGISCHDAAQLRAARAAGADYAFLGNVLPTPSHPGQPSLGWDKFSELIKDLPLPVYAIGGVGPDDLETAWAAGAQGVAGISAFWPK